MLNVVGHEAKFPAFELYLRDRSNVTMGHLSGARGTDIIAVLHTTYL